MTSIDKLFEEIYDSVGQVHREISKNESVSLEAYDGIPLSGSLPT